MMMTTEMRLVVVWCNPAQPVAVRAAHISEIWVGIGFGGEGLLPTAAR